MHSVRVRTLLGIALLVSLTGCGSSGSTSTATTTASSTAPPPTTNPPTTTPASPSPEPCGRPAPTTSAAAAVPAASALLSATVIVDSQTANAPHCVQLAFGQTVRLQLGDRAEFVANRAPDLMPPDSDAVRVTTRPGPTEVFGGLTTPHVVVSLTGVHPGSVAVRWIDCNGTGC